MSKIFLSSHPRIAYHSPVLHAFAPFQSHSGPKTILLQQSLSQHLGGEDQHQEQLWSHTLHALRTPAVSDQPRSGVLIALFLSGLVTEGRFTVDSLLGTFPHRCSVPLCHHISLRTCLLWTQRCTPTPSHFPLPESRASLSAAHNKPIWRELADT